MKVVASVLLLACVVPRAFAQSATVEPTPSGTAPAGSTVAVKWSGPNGRGDYITVVRKGAEPFEYLDYRATSDGRAPVNPVSIVMPAEPGAYEIRYVLGNPRRVLAIVPYEVTAIAATIEGPASIAPDARFEVAWSGPNNGGDWVTIVAAGAAPRAYGSYVDARTGRADEKTGRRVATLRAPTKPGQYELRYVQRGTVVIGTRAIEVTSSASQTASSPVVPVVTPPRGNTGSASVGPGTAAMTTSTIVAPVLVNPTVTGAQPTAPDAASSNVSPSAPATTATVTGTGATPTRVLASTTADLSTTLVASDPSGATVTSWPATGTARYTVSVTNRGPAAAKGALLRVPPVGGLQKMLVTCAASNGAECPSAPSVAGLEGGLSIPSLGPGGTVTVGFVARVRVWSGSVSVTGTVTGPAGVVDPNPGDNSASLTHSITDATPVGTSDTGVTLGWQGGFGTSWAPNSTAKYSVTIANGGPPIVNNGVLIVPATPGLSKTTVRCTVHPLRGGQCPPNPTVSQLEQGLTIPSLPGGGGAVTIDFEATVTAALGSTVSVTAAFIGPPGHIEYDSGDNARTQIHTIEATPAALAGRTGSLKPGATTAGTIAPAGTAALSAAATSCVLPGPVVSIKGVSPGHVHLKWDSLVGASAYSVSRSDQGLLEGRRNDGTGIAIPATEFLHSTPLYEGTTYRYTVTATFSQGCGSSEISVVPPRVVAPIARAAYNSGVTGSATFGIVGKFKPATDADGRMMQNVTGWVVFGSGLPADGIDIPLSSPQRTYWVGNCAWDTECTSEYRAGRIRDELEWNAVVPPGEHAWLVVPYLETDGGRMIDVRSGARVTLRVP